MDPHLLGAIVAALPCEMPQGDAFTPADIAGGVAWYRGDAFSDATGVATDLFGNGNDTDVEVGNVTEGTAYGQPAMVFDGLSYLRRATLQGGPQAQPVTTYCVFTLPLLATTEILFDGVAGARLAMFAVTAGANWNYFAGTTVRNANGDPVNNSKLCVAWDEVDTDTYIDNFVTPTASGASPGSDALGGVTLGANHLGSAPWTGSISEYIAYAGKHTAEQRAQMAAYFLSRYGV